MYDPKKYIDYSKRIKKVTLTEEEKKAQKAKAKENRIRTKLDKKRFYEAQNKKLVFYSEKSGFYKYYQTVIEYILSHSEVCIHYITSDPEDAVFSMKEPGIIPYYISDNTLMPVMMKMDAYMVVMTMPDIQQYHIKRSMVRKDIEYVYMFHYPLSTHMVLRKGALDHYDTIFCIGEFQITEIRETEKVYGLKEKKLVLNGYGLLEKLYEGYKNTPFEKRVQKKVLIAPSWQPDNILDSCIDKILDSILAKGYQIVVRPHPEYVKRFGDNMDAIVSRYESYKGSDLHFELDFSKSSSLFDSDIVISDWSGAAYEFAFVTKRPVIFINTPPKINNSEYKKISVQPLEISLRDRIGLQLEVNELGRLNEKIEELFQSAEQYKEKISIIFSEIIYEFGHSGEIGGKYILNALEEAGKRRESGDVS